MLDHNFSCSSYGLPIHGNVSVSRGGLELILAAMAAMIDTPAGGCPYPRAFLDRTVR
jgi:hypothetical protein